MDANHLKHLRYVGSLKQTFFHPFVKRRKKMTEKNVREKKLQRRKKRIDLRMNKFTFLEKKSLTLFYDPRQA